MLIFRALKPLNIRSGRPFLNHLSMSSFPDIYIDGPSYKVLAPGQMKFLDSLNDRSEVKLTTPTEDDEVLEKHVKALVKKTRRMRNKLVKILPPSPAPLAYPKIEKLYDGNAEFQIEIAAVFKAHKDRLRLQQNHDIEQRAGLFRQSLLTRLSFFKDRLAADGMTLEYGDVQKIIWRLYYDFAKLPVISRKLICRALACKDPQEPITVEQEEHLMAKVMAEQRQNIRSKLGKTKPRILTVDDELKIFWKFFKYFFERRRKIFGFYFWTKDDSAYVKEIMVLWNRMSKIGKKHWAIHFKSTAITPEEILKHKLRGKKHSSN